MSTRLFEMPILVGWFLFLIILVSCSSVDKKDDSLITSMTETRLGTLEAELKDQSLEIRRLSATIETLSVQLHARSAKKVKKSSSLPISEVKIPEPEEWAQGEPNQESSANSGASESVATDDSDGVLDIGSTVEEDSSEMEQTTVADSRHEGMHWYFNGLELLKKGYYDEAVSSFRSFLKGHSHHVYADRAEYWIAYAHFLSREFGLVVVAANVLESRYPNSFKIPDALYQKAEAFLGMGQKQEAKNTLRDLIRRFPRESIAATASRKLAELSMPQNGSPGHVPLLGSSGG